MFSYSNGWRRIGVVAAASALTLTSAVVVAAPTQAQPAGDRAISAGSSWLKAQLTDGVLHNDEYDYDDLGLSADVAFALDAVGGQDATVTQIVDAVERDAESWVGGYSPGRVYAGSLAKLVSVVQAADQDPAAFAGTDQVARLEDLVASTAPLTGRLEDGGVDATDPYDADFVNVIGQSFAARALTAAGSGRAADATSFLLEQQCSDGFFRASLTANKAAPEQGCDAGADLPNVDTTALAIINILDTPHASTSAKGAAYLGANWLKTQQATDGSFSAGELGANANTTGLAGWALAEAGQDAAATRAATWLRHLQVADLAPCTTTLAGDNGAIAYKPADLTAARAAGAFSVPIRELARRASAQALPALANVPAGSNVTIFAPATAVEQSTVTVTVAGLGAGEPACVSTGGQAKKVTGTGSSVALTFQLPAGAATNTFRVTTLTGSATAVTATTPVPVTTPTGSPVVGELAVAKVEKVKNNRIKLSVSCGGSVPCAGKLKVRTARKVELANGAIRKLLVAKSAYSVEAGETATVRLKLQRPARKVLGPKRLRVKATQTARGAEPASTRFWLRRK